MTNKTPPFFSIGLTGGIGSGKSMVADMFAKCGATIVDTDLIAHDITAVNGAAMQAIRAQFGDDYVNPDGAMNRARMRQLVFADAGAKQRLENIVHPVIRAEAEAAAARAEGAYVMFVVPLLIESGNWKQRVSRVCVVDCDEQTQISRVCRRNAFDEAQVRAIIASQVPRAVRLAAADDIVKNDGETSELAPQIERLHELYCSLTQTNRIFYS